MCHTASTFSYMVFYRVLQILLERNDKMNVKPAHLKKDLNRSRQKRNEAEKYANKEQFILVDLMNVPDFYCLRNEMVYASLV